MQFDEDETVSVKKAKGACSDVLTLEAYKIGEGVQKEKHQNQNQYKV